MDSTENGVVSESKKVDYELLAKKTQNEVARVAQINYERAQKGLPPLPVEPEEKLNKTPKHAVVTLNSPISLKEREIAWSSPPQEGTWRC